MAAAAAHTLKGSARGIGAWRVARAAERLELAAGKRDASDISDGDRRTRCRQPWKRGWRSGCAWRRMIDAARLRDR